MASTLVSTLYPPLVDTFMPAFVHTDEKGAQVVFALSPYNAAEEIQRIHVTVVDQTTNQNVLKTTSIPDNIKTVWDATDKGKTICIDGVMIVPFKTVSSDQEGKIYSLNIPPSMLKPQEKKDENGNLVVAENSGYSWEKWYKVQLRLDATPITAAQKPISTQYLIEARQYFSEWSSVCLIKPIKQPVLVLQGFERADREPDYAVPFAPGYIHLVGTVNDSDDILQSFRFTLKNMGETVADSGIQYPQRTNEINYLFSADNVRPGDKYTLHIDMTTKNQYSFSKEYQIKISSYDTKYQFHPKFNLTENTEDGYVDINITAEPKNPEAGESASSNASQYVPGKMYVKRASSKDNFKTWELISCTNQINSGQVSETIRDFTVASMVQYKYSVQFWFENTNTWSMVTESEIIYPTFYDIMLSREGIQLAIRYNGQLTSMKQNIQRTKFDTLGSKYPKFAENAKMNYRQYSLSGLICAEGDFNRMFMSELEEPYQTNMKMYDKVFGESYMLRNDTLADGIQETGAGTGYAPDGRVNAVKNSLHDVYPHENWYWERTFRDAVIEWLNDGEPKLFRSMPEGNMIVMVTDVSLTPNQQIGRLLYNFTATVYEIGDGYSLTSLNNAGVIDVPTAQEAYIFDFDYDDEYQGIVIGSSISFNQIQLPVQLEEQTSNSLKNVFINKINEKNDGVFESYEVNEDKLLFKNVQVQFIVDDKENKPVLLKEVKEEDIVTLDIVSEEDDANTKYYYGFGLNINNNLQTVLVNPSGYYRFPSDTLLTDLEIVGGKAYVTFVAEYDKIIKSKNKPASSYVEKSIIGQEVGYFEYNKWLGEEIKEKYLARVTNKEQQTIDTQELTKFDSVVFDLVSYSIVEVVFENTTDPQLILIGRSGTYKLQPEYSITELRVCGRRMVLNDRAEYKELDSWEFRYAQEDEVLGHRNTIYKNEEENTIYYNGKYCSYHLENENDDSIIIVHTPIEGTITYVGDILQHVYVDQQEGSEV